MTAGSEREAGDGRPHLDKNSLAGRLPGDHAASDKRAQVTGHAQRWASSSIGNGPGRARRGGPTGTRSEGRTERGVRATPAGLLWGIDRAAWRSGRGDVAHTTSGPRTGTRRPGSDFF